MTHYYTKAEAECLIFWHEAVLDYIRPSLKALGITDWRAQDNAVREIIPHIEGDKETETEILTAYLAKRSK